MQSVTVEYQTSEQVATRAARLVGMTFRDVLDLEIMPEGVSREYNSRRYKGGMGTLLEERFFGYRANSDRDPDFAEAGVELKATCIDKLKSGRLSAGERLVEYTGNKAQWTTIAYRLLGIRGERAAEFDGG